MKFKTHARRPIGLDMTPMIDTVFNLLIFFALSFNFVTTPGIQVRLPKASTEPIPSQRNEVLIAISREGDLFMDRRRTTDRELLATLRRLPEETKDAGLAIIQADERVTHGRVVTIMDLVKQAGLKRIAIATQPPAPEEIGARER